MRYYGGNTITESDETATKKSVTVSDIEGSVTITTLRDGKFTLHRVGYQQPARFHKTHSSSPNMPILSDGDEKHESIYTVFSVEGDTITEGSLLRLTTHDGHSEAHLVQDLYVHAPETHQKSWMRSGRRGILRMPNRSRTPQPA